MGFNSGFKGLIILKSASKPHLNSFVEKYASLPHFLESCWENLTEGMQRELFVETSHVSPIVHFQLYAKEILIYLHIIHLLKSSTCFEHYPAHLQEVYVVTVYMQPLVSSLCKK